MRRPDMIVMASLALVLGQRCPPRRQARVSRRPESSVPRRFEASRRSRRAGSWPPAARMTVGIWKPGREYVRTFGIGDITTTIT